MGRSPQGRGDPVQRASPLAGAVPALPDARAKPAQADAWTLRPETLVLAVHVVQSPMAHALKLPPDMAPERRRPAAARTDMPQRHLPSRAREAT